MLDKPVWFLQLKRQIKYDKIHKEYEFIIEMILQQDIPDNFQQFNVAGPVGTGASNQNNKTSIYSHIHTTNKYTCNYWNKPI